MYFIHHKLIPSLVVVDTMMEQQFATKRLDPIPSEIRSPEAKLVYLYVEATGAATADELCNTLSLKKMSVLSVLNSLSAQGLIEKDDGAYVTSA